MFLNYHLLFQSKLKIQFPCPFSKHKEIIWFFYGYLAQNFIFVL